MQPSALRIERLPAKVEAEHNARARPCRYVVYEDEYDEAITKGLPLPRYFFLMPRGIEPRGMGEQILPRAGGRRKERLMDSRQKESRPKAAPCLLPNSSVFIRVSDGVLHVTGDIMRGALRLVDFAFRLQLLIAGYLAG
jgi:hypothetical protein